MGSEVATGGVLSKNVFLKILKNWQEKRLQHRGFDSSVCQKKLVITGYLEQCATLPWHKQGCRLGFKQYFKLQVIETQFWQGMIVRRQTSNTFR